ncbi:MAG: acyl-CoA thioesterase [Bacteroidetes bacterium]|nr:acyl-CoA thioesterase [Bacteroidota bacterium]
MFTGHYSFRVRYGETDQMNVVYHANYATYFEIGRTEAIRTLGCTYREMEEMGIEMPVTELSIRYLRAARYDEQLTVRTELRELPQKHTIDFHQTILNEKSKLVATGKVTLFFVDRKTRRWVRMPEDLRLRLAPFFASETPR